MDEISTIIRSIYAEPIMFFYTLALYYYLPSMSSLYLYKVCLTVYKYNKSLCIDLVNSNFTAETKHEEDLVSAESSRWMFYQTILFVIPSVIMSVVIGIYTDKTKDRRLAFISPIMGQLFGGVYGLIMAKTESAHVGWLLISSFCTGLSGGFATFVMAVFSHISVETDIRYRTLRLTIVQGVMMFGNVLGSLTAGPTLQQADIIDGWVYSFSIIISVCLINVLFTITTYNCASKSESYHQTPRTDHSRLPTLRNARTMFRVICSHCPSVLQLCLAAIMFIWVSGLGKYDVLYSFTQRMKLNRAYYGYYTGYDAAVQAVAGIAGVYFLKNCMLWRDTSLAILGLLSSILCSLAILFSGIIAGAFPALFWMSPALGMFQMITPMSLRSVAASLVDESAHSQLFSFISSADALLQLFTAALFQFALWPYTEAEWPSISFIVVVFLSMTCLLLTTILHRKLGFHARNTYTDLETETISS